MVAYLYAGYATMTAALGEPRPDDISDPGKIDAEWNIPVDGGIVNIYSYHDVQPEHRHVPLTQPGVTVEWHVQPASSLEALARLVFGEDGYTITREDRWPGDSTGRLNAAGKRMTSATDCTCDQITDAAANPICDACQQVHAEVVADLYATDPKFRAALLRELWRRNYMTWASCQDCGDGTAQIVFYAENIARAFCYEAIRMADDLPAGWTRKVTAAPFPGFPPLCAVWFPRELLARFNARQRKREPIMQA